MNLTFNDEQIAEIYQLITTQNADFVRRLARASIVSSAAIKADMWSQMDDPKPGLPSIGDIKDMSLDYFSDALHDFEQAFDAAVKAEPAEVGYDLQPALLFKG